MVNEIESIRKIVKYNCNNILRTVRCKKQLIHDLHQASGLQNSSAPTKYQNTDRPNPL